MESRTSWYLMLHRRLGLANDQRKPVDVVNNVEPARFGTIPENIVMHSAEDGMIVARKTIAEGFPTDGQITAGPGPMPVGNT